MQVLIADDEKPLANFLYKGLSSEGYQCDVVNNLQDVIPYIKQHRPHIVVLDRLFDKQDSLSIIAQIKALSSAPMILMLTALDEVDERVNGLQKGADDYLCKPFDFDELLARINALGRRFIADSGINENTLSLGGLELLLDQRIVLLDKDELAMTKIEYDLLLYLAQNMNKVLSRERILGRVWRSNSDPHTNIIDVYISKLRKKLEKKNNITIQTLRGSGYRLNLENTQGN